ncbi:MAG: ferritin [Planctomycetota bacterium]|nr:MAG: ferritin [Planctomycetota bacterium]
MQISKKMNDALNAQITLEFQASQAYLGMMCMFESMGLKVLGGKFRAQSEEERGHAMKIVDYLLEVGGDVAIGELPAPKMKYDSVADAVEAALGHEQHVTKQVHKLVDLARKENDHATFQFLQWFVEEQVEEISSMENLLQIVKMAGPALLNIEAYLIHMDKGE